MAFKVAARIFCCTEVLMISSMAARYPCEHRTSPKPSLLCLTVGVWYLFGFHCGLWLNINASDLSVQGIFLQRPFGLYLQSNAAMFLFVVWKVHFSHSRLMCLNNHNQKLFYCKICPTQNVFCFSMNKEATSTHTE